MERAGIDINARDGAGQTVLHIASAKGFGALLKILLGKTHLDLNAKDGNGQTPLHLAARGGHEEVCQMLVGAGAGTKKKHAVRLSICKLHLIDLHLRRRLRG